MSAAPTADAVSPSTVTPPDAPGTVGRNVRIDRGRARERDPISVAQVSAVAVATAPPNPAMKSDWIRLRVSDDANAKTAATLPRAGAHTDGVVGLRIGAGLNLHVSAFDVTRRLAPR